MIKPIELESADGNDVWNTLTAAGAGDARFRKRRPMNAVRLWLSRVAVREHASWLLWKWRQAQQGARTVTRRQWGHAHFGR
jgi:hypothetical protein